jgi:uncharacterized phage protein (TIGR01671 family)
MKTKQPEREIKFRVWNKEKKEMIFKGFMIRPDNGWCITDEVSGDELIPIKIDCELMQYTGLKDSKGVEAYEGDIYHCGYECQDGTHKYGDRNIIEDIRTFEPEDSFEIIGNIYENSSLINKLKNK